MAKKTIAEERPAQHVLMQRGAVEATVIMGRRDPFPYSIKHEQQDFILLLMSEAYATGYGDACDDANDLPHSQRVLR